MTTEHLTIKQYYDNDEMGIGDMAYDIQRCSNWDELLIRMQDTVKNECGKVYALSSSYAELRKYYEEQIIEALEVDMQLDLEDIVIDIRIVDNMPDWIRDDFETEIREAKEEVEDGYMCVHCAGSGEGMADGTTCPTCNGSGQIRLDGIFEGEMQ